MLDRAVRAVAERQEGAFSLLARMDEVEHGLVQVTGAGLFMPVMVSGTGQIAAAPAMPAG